jgi:DNA polymerase-3 subunit delta
MEAAEFINRANSAKPQPIYVLTGDENFLRRRALAAIQRIVIGDADPDLAVSSYPGDAAVFSTIRNELDTLPFLCDARLVIIDQADKFVTEYRAQLEKYVTQPASRGVLVLDVKTWTSTTRLAKAIPEAATISCKGPGPAYLPAWCQRWAEAEYEKKITLPVARLLVELVGDEMGLLDSELNKLAIYVGDNPSIASQDVDQLVGQNRGANVFKILDAIGDRKPAEAIRIVEELLEEGESPLAILGALGSQLRKLGMAARLHKQGAALDGAMKEAGVFPWAKENTQKVMRHLGWSRLDKLFDWLIETDLGLKGETPLPEEAVLERLIVLLARQAPAKATSG